MNLSHLKYVFVGLTIAMLTPSPATADTRDENFDNTVANNGRAIVIEMQNPQSPRHRARRLQEAWMQMSYVVTADGHAIDPIIVDSSGGIDFENELRKVSELWSFEISDGGAELPGNMVQSRFLLQGRGKGTTRTFARHSLHIMKALHNEDIEKARKNADSAVRLGGWNLYESTILWLMLGRVAGAEDNPAEQLEMYQRGLAVSSAKSLRRDARADLLESIMGLQKQFGHYAAALRSFELLTKVLDGVETVARMAPMAAEIRDILADEETVTAQATIANPCNCEGGVPLWHYSPERRTFSFDNIAGNVTSFEARCDLQRISGDVESGKQWHLPDDWGYCQVFVFGDDGASFDFLGHLQGAEPTSEPVVAKN